MANINNINGSSKIKDTYTTIYNNDDAINTELESHLASLVAHLASEIENDSDVTGAKSSDALNTLLNLINNISAGDSNAQIGLYSINDTSNTNDYVGDLGTTTLFGGMNLFLYVENKNTDNVTLDITDGNGAKSIKKYVDETKVELDIGDLTYGYNLLKYDGTDWVLIASNLGTNQTTHTQTESIKSLPVGSLDGNVVDLNLDGFSTVQEVIDGDVSTTVTSDNTGDYIDINIDGTWEFLNTYDATNQTFNVTISDKIFVYAKLDSTSVGDISDILLKYSSGNEDTLGLTNGNELYGIINATETNLANIKIVEGASGDVIKESQMLQNLTQTGIDTYLDTLGLTTDAQKEEFMLDVVRNGYVEELVSLVNPSIEVVGKNLFDGNWTLGGIDSTGNDTAQTDRVRTDYIRVKGNTDYVQSNDLGDAMSIYEYNSNKDFIKQTLGVLSGDGITTEPNTSYVRYRIIGTETDNSIIKSQFEEGTSATEYEPRQSNKITLQDTFRSLPSGVKDTAGIVDNEVVKVERVSKEFTFDGDESWSGYANGKGLNNDISTMEINGFATNNNLAYSEFGGILAYMENQGLMDNLDVIGSAEDISIVIYSANSRLLIGIPTADLPTDDASGFTTYLSNNPVIAQFELAQPNTKNLTELGLVDGSLSSYENGTVYNTADTLMTPYLDFKVPTNRGQQIDNLIEVTEMLSKELVTKASRQQEEVINPTLINSWIGTPYYYKNEVEEVKLSGLVQSGSGVAFTLPTGYRPSVIKNFKQSDTTTGNPTVEIDTDGTVTPSADCYLDGISFRVGE